jgi:hypothetical protein
VEQQVVHHHHKPHLSRQNQTQLSMIIVVSQPMVLQIGFIQHHTIIVRTMIHSGVTIGYTEC